MKKLFLMAFLLLVSSGYAESKGNDQDKYEGLWQGYDGEWKHVSKQLIELAEATQEDKFSWRPAKGVRSTSEGLHAHRAHEFLSPQRDRA